MWGWISYDPALDLIFYGTANPGPWNPEQRPGDNKWSSTMFARRPETGEAIWAYQMNPHDLHDYDGVNESLLLDIPWHGSRRGVLLHPDRNGYLYAMDRATGEVLYAKPYVHITSSDSVNVATGELALNEQKEPRLRTGGPRHLSGGSGRKRLAAVLRFRRAQDSSTCLTRICAWTRRRRRRATSRARRTSG